VNRRANPPLVKPRTCIRSEGGGGCAGGTAGLNDLEKRDNGESVVRRGSEGRIQLCDFMNGHSGKWGKSTGQTYQDTAKEKISYQICGQGDVKGGGANKNRGTENLNPSAVKVSRKT